jgi:hypothetical protein
MEDDFVSAGQDRVSGKQRLVCAAVGICHCGTDWLAPILRNPKQVDPKMARGPPPRNIEHMG